MINAKSTGIPTHDEAQCILEEAGKLNPGGWVDHSKYVAEGAKLIAENARDMNPEVAYILGLLHDIGRRVGMCGMKHGLEGYKYAIENGYDLLARICLSHIAFKHEGQVIIVGKWDGTDEERDFVKAYLGDKEDSDYDKLIKLCDYLSLPSGFCLIEKRLVDIGLRGGLNEYTLPRWKSTFENKKYFEGKMGKSIYSILPGVVENTFNK